MAPKILVINGHGAKNGQHFKLDKHHGIITPGVRSDNYTLSFDNFHRHLEEMTSQQMLWPITSDGMDEQWRRYSACAVEDLSITPLQAGFSFGLFKTSLLNKTTNWEHLSVKPHVVLDASVLVIKTSGGSYQALEGEDLTEYLSAGSATKHAGQPIFFCDKALGKIKPMRETTLSEITQALNVIPEYQNQQVTTVVATCSALPGGKKAIEVKTSAPALSISSIIDAEPQVMESPMVDIMGTDIGGTLELHDELELTDFVQVKTLTKGKTNQVSLWQHYAQPSLQVVVKTPYGKDQQLIEQNIRAINAFFGEGSACRVKDSNSFAMRYFKGQALTPDEVGRLVNDKNSEIRTIERNGHSFTMLDPNEDNFIKLPTGEIIPIDFDYMLMHEQSTLPEYMITYLEGRKAYCSRVSDASTAEATEYVVGSYPKARDLLIEKWGKRYLSQQPVYKAVEVTTLKAAESILQSKQLTDAISTWLQAQGLNGVNFFARVKNFIVGASEHNLAQPIDNIQFEFASAAQQDEFVKLIEPSQVAYLGFGFSQQPIVQVKPEFFSALLSKPLEADMTLSQTLVQVEQQVGSFAAYQATTGHEQNIPFELKPAQQLLAGLDVDADPRAPLSKLKSGVLAQEGNLQTSITSFDESQLSMLTIDGDRLDRLVRSSKVYVNTDIMPTGLYAETMAKGSITPQDKTQSAQTNIHWQNMAVGICHAQEIDLLVEQDLSTGKAVAKPKTGHITADMPAVLLLSSPALNFAYGVARNLSAEQQQAFIRGMFRNLFAATLAEGRNYIAMPAAGLGVFGGQPQLYFSTLMEIAAEFPELNIIYHPAQFASAFEDALSKASPSNVVRATKDVLFIAEELTQQGKLCAFHNPSDSDVVYGVYDVGEYWKNGTGAGYVGEERIGATTTAPLNSNGLNPSAYQRVVEQSFVKQAVKELPPELEKEAELLDIVEPMATDESIKTHKALLIDGLLQGFEQKINSNTDASEAGLNKARQLLQTLRGLNQDYDRFVLDGNKDGAPSFQQRFAKEINQARPILEKELGWGSWLMNFAKHIANVFIGISHTFGSDFTFFQKAHAPMVDDTADLAADIERTFNPA